jgi:hypothetical protein
MKTRGWPKANSFGLVADIVDYGDTKNRLERLASTLKLPGK